MKNIDRWLLPDGIGEVLPGQAEQLELLRRRLLDLYQTWGYELVIPPLLEFTESLLTDTNRDLDLQTFKVTDQLSGRSMGIRADITPQAARIDAHSLNRNGPVRLCYAGSVLHTRPSSALASRSPIQVGVECFGIKTLLADIEVISLMVETISAVQPKNFTLSLGHVEIFRALAEQAKLNKTRAEVLLSILQRKASTELQAFLSAEKLSADAAETFRQLVGFNGDVSVLARAKQYFSKSTGAVITALSELELVAAQIIERYPQLSIHVDLAELPGYHYHNGIVFAAYANGAGAAIANGGRYDAVSELFGRSRGATGFNADLKTLLNLGSKIVPNTSRVVAEINNDPQQWQAIVALRAQGEIVVCVESGQLRDHLVSACDRQLVCEHDQYVVKPIS